MIDTLKKLSAHFPPDAVSWRVGSMTADKKKGMALAYIDARDVMDRLDEAVGPENWQRRYPWSDGKRLCCEIGIRFDADWIWKSDGAGDTDVEAEKGCFSDAFKRAAVSWGIGRYLYGLKSPWVELEPFGRSYKIAEKEEAKLRAVLVKAAGSAPAPIQQRGTAKPQDAKAPANGNAAQVPVPVNAEGTGSDWKAWGTYLIPSRIRACRSAEEVQAVLDANSASLEELKKVSPAAYNGLEAMWTKAINGWAGKAA